jgi:hypothetical protein
MDCLMELETSKRLSSGLGVQSYREIKVGSKIILWIFFYLHANADINPGQNVVPKSPNTLDQRNGSREQDDGGEDYNDRIEERMNRNEEHGELIEEQDDMNQEQQEEYELEIELAEDRPSE